MSYEYKGTPGPWALSEDWNIPMQVLGRGEHPGFESRSTYITDINNNVLGDVKAFETTGFVKKDVYEANAHLIVSAPLLLSALIKAVEEQEMIRDASNHVGIEVSYPDWYYEAKAAIASALNLPTENARS